MKVGRNDPCPCGSGRKHKQCCLASAPSGAAAHLDFATLNAQGAVLQGQGRPEDAAARYREAIALAPSKAELHFNLATALHDQGLLDQAIDCYRQALVRRPDLVVAHNNLGNALAARGAPDAALASYGKALALAPDHVEARFNLGVAQQQVGRLDAAIGTYRRLLRAQPGRADAHYNLGNACRDAGRVVEAIEAYHAALRLQPGYRAARVNLGQVLGTDGRLDEAIDCFTAALSQGPPDAGLYSNLGNVQQQRGDLGAALASYRRALELDDAPHIRANFARGARHWRWAGADVPMRELLTRAIVQAWIRPADLAAAAAEAIDCTLDDAALCADQLLLALLVSAPVAALPLERRLTRLRRTLLERAVGLADPREAQAEAGLELACALARQCFINEFVFACDDRELAQVGVVRERIAAALAACAPVHAYWVAATAAYVRLDDIAHANALLERTWPAPLSALLAEQVAEPAEERRYATEMPTLTAVDDVTSVRVRGQYEEHPYPRWARAESVVAVATVEGYLRRQFPFAPLESLPADGRADMLIAGCGTGQESVAAARQFPDARILAVDLSRASLGYARRKSLEAGAANVAYAQADLLRMGELERTFDVVSSMGVLHHLAEPAAGLRALAGVLRAGGVMRLGLYSERGRRDVVAARAFIAERGYAPDAAGIRQCRQDLAARAEFSSLTARRDFHATSACRDLLFHVREQRLTIPAIAAWLDAHALRFVGFLLEPDVAQRYAQRFPDDRSRTELACWDAFEAEFPDTFAGMYRFWVQRGRD